MKLQKEKEALQSNHHKELSDYKAEIKHLQEENTMLEKQLKEIKGSCEDLTFKNKSLEQSLQNSKKTEVSKSMPNIVYIETEKTEQSIDCVICFVE